MSFVINQRDAAFLYFTFGVLSAIFIVNGFNRVGHKPELQAMAVCKKWIIKFHLRGCSQKITGVADWTTTAIYRVFFQAKGIFPVGLVCGLDENNCSTSGSWVDAKEKAHCGSALGMDVPGKEVLAVKRLEKVRIVISSGYRWKRQTKALVDMIEEENS